MKRWQAYIDFQTAVAHPDGPIVDLEHVDRALDECLLAGLVPAGRSMLVIGPGGAGELARLVAAGFSRVTAVTPMLREYEALVAEGWDVRFGDMHALPYLSGTVGGVFASNVLEHALAPYVALMEIRRVLPAESRSRGFAYFVIPEFEGEGAGTGPFHLHCLDQKVWSELLRKTGFQVDSLRRARGILHPTVHYLHIFAWAVDPPPPHDGMLARIKELADADP